MPRRMYILKPGEFGFNDRVDEYFPIKGNEQEIVRGFSDYTVKQALERTATIDGAFLVVVDETNTNYKAETIYACPECGYPLKKQGRGATTARYICPKAEVWQNIASLSNEHDYVRVWSREELIAHSTAKPA